MNPAERLPKYVFYLAPVFVQNTNNSLHLPRGPKAPPIEGEGGTLTVGERLV